MLYAYKTILIKLSGEVLSGTKGYNIDDNTITNIAHQIQEIHNNGIKIAIVIGGGNFWRGRQNLNINRVDSDYIGMLATIMNSLALCDKLNQIGINTKIYSMLKIEKITEEYSNKKVKDDLNNNTVVIFAGGTGSPYFSTDSNAALKAIEINADMLFLGKNIDGVYNDDPKLNKNAKKYSNITYEECILKKLKIIDLTALVLCMENKMPIKIFDLRKENSIINTVMYNNNDGTIIK